MGLKKDKQALAALQMSKWLADLGAMSDPNPNGRTARFAASLNDSAQGAISAQAQKIARKKEEEKNDGIGGTIGTVLGGAAGFAAGGPAGASAGASLGGGLGKTVDSGGQDNAALMGGIQNATGVMAGMNKSGGGGNEGGGNGVTKNNNSISGDVDVPNDTKTGLTSDGAGATGMMAGMNKSGGGGNEGGGASNVDSIAPKPQANGPSSSGALSSFKNFLGGKQGLDFPTMMMSMLASQGMANLREQAPAPSNPNVARIQAIQGGGGGAPPAQKGMLGTQADHSEANYINEFNDRGFLQRLLGVKPKPQSGLQLNDSGGFTLFR